MLAQPYKAARARTSVEQWLKNRAGTDSDRATEFHALAFEVGGHSVWSVDLRGGDIREARLRACAEMEAQAKALGVSDFDGLIKSLAAALGWEVDAARALALAFVFPRAYAIERITARWVEPKRRGRPTSVKRALLVQKLALAWIDVTKSPAGIRNSRFQAAFAAAAPYLGFGSMRGRELLELEQFLRQEQRKLRAHEFTWVKPLHQGGDGSLQLTTPSGLEPDPGADN